MGGGAGGGRDGVAGVSDHLGERLNGERSALSVVHKDCKGGGGGGGSECSTDSCSHAIGKPSTALTASSGTRALHEAPMECPRGLQLAF